MKSELIKLSNLLKKHNMHTYANKVLDIYKKANPVSQDDIDYFDKNINMTTSPVDVSFVKNFQDLKSNTENVQASGKDLGHKFLTKYRSFASKYSNADLTSKTEYAGLKKEFDALPQDAKQFVLDMVYGFNYYYLKMSGLKEIVENYAKNTELEKDFSSSRNTPFSGKQTEDSRSYDYMLKQQNAEDKVAALSLVRRLKYLYENFDRMSEMQFDNMFKESENTYKSFGVLQRRAVCDGLTYDEKNFYKFTNCP